MQEFLDVIEVLLIVGLVLWCSSLQARIKSLESNSLKSAQEQS